MLYLSLTKPELETKKIFFETHLKNLNNIKIDPFAEKIDATTRQKIFYEAGNITPAYLGFVELGMHIFSKSWNYPWKLWTYIPTLNPVTKAPEMQTYYEIGETAAKKDPKLLLDQLQEGCNVRLHQINLAMDKIKYNENLAEIESLDSKIRAGQRVKGEASKRDIENMQSLVEETSNLEERLKKAKLIYFFFNF